MGPAWPAGAAQETMPVPWFLFASKRRKNQASFLCDIIIAVFLKKIYLFLVRGGREGEREEKKHQCAVTSPVAPDWVPCPQPRHVP